MKKYIVFAVLATLVILTLSACARKISFQNSSVVPAARGTVKIKKDNNHNYHIQISLVNLAEVSRLVPAKQSYVVWMESGDDKATNIGQINSSSSMLSKKLKASFETVSSSNPSKIFITAEDDVKAEYPGTQMVLTTDRF